MKRQKANSLENVRCSKELTCFEGLLGHVLRSFEIVELISDIARFTTPFELVSLAAVFSIVTQRSSPQITLARLVPEICKLHGDWFKWWKGMLFECEQPFVGRSVA